MSSPPMGPTPRLDFQFWVSTWGAGATIRRSCPAFPCGLKVDDSSFVSTDGLYKRRATNPRTSRTGPSVAQFTNYAFRIVADTTGGIPEPETWALFLVGVGAVGGALRVARRKRTATQSA